MHAIGDRAVRNALDACEAARAANGARDSRHHVAHLQVIHPEDVPRFRELGVIANCQPYWAQHDPQMDELTIPFLGPERAPLQYPFASLHAAGATLAFGSDWSVSTANPLEEMEVAIRRADPSTREIRPFLPDQRLPLPLALAAFTKGSSYVNRDDDAGSIEVGNRADLVVLDRNLFDAPEAQVADARVGAHDRLRPRRLRARLSTVGCANAAASSDSHGRPDPRGVPQSVTSEEGSVELVDVTKRFADVVAVDALSLQVQPAEFLSLLGPSGCGKTTTLRMLAGFEEPTAGQIFISGQAVQGTPPHKRNVNTVFQHFALFPHMSVAENVAYGLRQKKEDKSQIGQKVGEALEMVKMSPLANRKPRQLSGGQQQRVALARALVNRPSLLLLDEPLGALDRKLREEMQIELKLLQSQVGITFIFVTHDQGEALSMSDRIAVMLDGHVEQLADPDTIYDYPASAFVAGFIGQQNFFDGTARESGSVVEGDGWTIRSSNQSPDAVDGRPALAAIRPEAVQLQEEQPGDPVNSVLGTLAGISHLGDVIQFVVLTRGQKEILCRLPRPRAPKLEVGGDVWCTWDPDQVHVFDAGQADVVLADPAATGTEG